MWYNNLLSGGIMPIYVYICENCNKEQEFILPHGKEANICLFCGGRLKKLLQPPAIQFKGSGFYINDYAKSNPKDKKKDEKESAKPEVSKK